MLMYLLPPPQNYFPGYTTVPLSPAYGEYSKKLLRRLQRTRLILVSELGGQDDAFFCYLKRHLKIPIISMILTNQ